MRVIEVEKVLIILRLLQFGWSDERKAVFEDAVNETKVKHDP